MRNRTNQQLEEITAETLIVGVDVAKSVQWARFVDYRGMEVGKTVSFPNNRQGFESIVARIQEICNTKPGRYPFEKVIIGMEPTGHYWKALANYLMKAGYKVVGVNPYHTKKSKELDDNSPTKSDKKDAITIARLVKDGRYFAPYMPEKDYGELRGLTNARVSVMKRGNAVKNTMTAILDEYFPEIWTVFKNPLKGKASRQVLRNCPFPALILALGEEGVLAEIKRAVKKTVGIQKVRQLIAAAEESVGVGYGLEAAKMRLYWLLDELELIEKQLAEVEQAMEQALNKTGYAELMLGIQGIGVVTAASFLGEVGDPLRFQNARQIANYAGYNLVEDSSGKSKSGTCISKRGRRHLRSVLYQMAFTMVGKNAEMKALYDHLTTRKANPLKKKQALVVVSKKIITVIYSLLKKREAYKPERVLGEVRKEKMRAA
ncbi:MAG: transposase [Desulfosporosinus sp. BRH_c37]|nr:MAG: transposase [Desulfosporosinus sp. BRH_c37]